VIVIAGVGAMMRLPERLPADFDYFEYEER
jgi:hypothetical protein